MTYLKGHVVKYNGSVGYSGSPFCPPHTEICPTTWSSLCQASEDVRRFRKCEYLGNQRSLIKRYEPWLYNKNCLNWVFILFYFFIVICTTMKLKSCKQTHSRDWLPYGLCEYTGLGVYVCVLMTSHSHYIQITSCSYFVSGFHSNMPQMFVFSIQKVMNVVNSREGGSPHCCNERM